MTRNWWSTLRFTVSLGVKHVVMGTYIEKLVIGDWKGAHAKCNVEIVVKHVVFFLGCVLGVLA